MADLVIVGSHRKRGWRALISSTAESVLHGTQCNVCTVMTEDSLGSASTHRYQRILVAINDSRDAKAVANEAVRLANLHAAHLSIASVVDNTKPWNTYE